MADGKKKRLLPSIKSYISEIKRYAPLVLLPLLLGLVLFFCVWGVIANEVEAQGNSIVRHFQSQADGVLREMELVSNAIISDGKFTECINKTTDEFDPDQIRECIRQKVLESPYVSHAYVMMPSHDRIYTETAYYPHESLSVVLSELCPGDKGPTSSRIVRDILDIDAGWHLPDSAYSIPYYVSDIQLDNGQEAKLLVSTNMRAFLATLFEPNAVLCCAFNEHVSFSSMLRNLPNVDWRNPQDIARLAKIRVKCFYTEGDNLSYLVAISTKAYYAPLRVVISVFCVYFAAVLVFGWFYLRSVSQRRYRETVAMLEGIPQVSSANPTFHEAISAVNTSLEDYRKERDFLLRMERREQLVGILSGRIARSASASELEDLGVKSTPYGYWVAVLIPAGDTGVTVSGTGKANEDLTCLVLESVFSTLGGDRLSACFAAVRRDYYAVLSVLDAAVTGEDIRSVLTQLASIIESEYALKLYIAVSAPISDSGQLADACSQAKQLRAFARSIDSQTPVVLKKDMESGAGVLLNGDFLSELQVLSRTLSLGKYDLVPQMVETVLANQVSKLRQRYDLADERLRAVAGLLCEAILSAELPGLDKDNAIAALRRADSVQKLNNAASSIFGEIVQRTASNPDPTVEMAISFIQEHLGDPALSVPEIAEAAEVSVPHLSRIFKRDCGRTIVEYINTLRIEKAKDLLLDRDLTVQRVAESTGYSNVVTFTRNFKRYVGASPSEFRMLNK